MIINSDDISLFQALCHCGLLKKQSGEKRGLIYQLLVHPLIGYF